MGGDKEKAFIPLMGKPILAWTLLVFESFPRIREMIVVVPPGQEGDYCREILSPYNITKAKVTAGGVERQDSLLNGFSAIDKPVDLVVVHDGARPFLNWEVLGQTLDAAEQTGAAVTAVPVKDTIKIGDENGMVQKTLDRNLLWAAQTPQAYRYEIIKHALEQAKADNFYSTDDASLVERVGMPVRIVVGDYENIKITSPEDLIFGEAILRRRQQNTV